MPNPRLAILVSGLVLCALGALMLIPALVDWLGNSPQWVSFLASSGFTMFVGICMILATHRKNLEKTQRIGRRQALLLVNCTWGFAALFGAVPFLLPETGVGSNLSFVDGFFESVSGITTTGATVLHNLDAASGGILLWRALLQWVGGIGVVVTTVALLPALHLEGMQFFQVEGFETEKFTARASQMATEIALIYLLFTLLAALFFWIFGMTGIEAFVHAMTSIATGGYSTSDQSFGHFSQGSLHWIAVLTMIAGALPFALYLRLLRGQKNAVWQDQQAWGFLLLLLGITFATTIWLMQTESAGFWQTFQRSAFNTVSVMTGTGYASADFSLWGGGTLFLVLMMLGGCAGSTTCGIKFFRIRIAIASVIAHLRKLSEPSGVFPLRTGQKKFDHSLMESAAVFVMIFFATILLLAVGLGICGLDFRTAVSGAVAAVANVGPGLGQTIGPEGNYASLSDAAKGLFIFGMFLGRLEILAVLVLLLPSFWRR